MAARDSGATITVRVIKSFPYRTCKNLVIGRLDLSTVTVGVIKAMVENGKLNTPFLLERPVRSGSVDCFVPLEKLNLPSDFSIGY